MQHGSKSTAALPGKPADYKEFVSKLARQSDLAINAQCLGINQSISARAVTGVTGRKRQSNDATQPECAASKKPARAVPRVQAQGSFYAKQNTSFVTVNRVQPDAGGCGETIARQPPSVPCPIGTDQGAPTEPPLNAAPASGQSTGPELLGRAAGADGGAPCLGSGAPRRALWVPGTAPRAEFKLQQQAFEFLDRQGEPWAQQLRVFGTELSSDGKRRFLVTTPARLWAEDVEPAPPGSCHLYEIIREGAPCHLYFDLEFVPEFNPGVCGDSLVDELVGLVSEELRAAFGIDMPLQRRASKGEEEEEEHWRQALEQQPQRLAAAQQEGHIAPQDLAAPQEQQQQSVEAQQQQQQLQGAVTQLGPGQQQPPESQRGLGQQEQDVDGDDEAGADGGNDGSEGVTHRESFAGTHVARGVAGPDAVGPGSARPASLPPAAARGAHGTTARNCGDGSCPWVWELCSTTAAKFSRHLVIRIPHCAFKDNFHVNAFVRRLFDRIAADPARFAAFFVRRSADPNDPPTLFIDPAVYTRNRAFRLYLSSKAGKTAVLRATNRYAVAALLQRRHRSSRSGVRSPIGPQAAAGSRSPRQQLPTAPEPAPGNAHQRVAAPEVPRPTLLVAEDAALPKAPAAASSITDSASGPCAGERATGAQTDAAGSGAAAFAAAAVPQPPDTVKASRGGCDGILEAPRVVEAEAVAAIARGVFLATLVTGVGRVDRTLTLYDDCGGGRGVGGIGSGVMATSLAGFHSAADAAGPGAERAHMRLGIPRLPIPAGGRRDPAGGRPGAAPGVGQAHGAAAAAAPVQYGPSPFPRIDAFVESVCCEGGVQGRVRCWQYLAESGALLLSMRNNRWCANVGRSHRSNGIFYQVDLRAGTWHQRCHDPQCRDFRSARMPLPLDLWEQCNGGLLAEQQQPQQPPQQPQYHQPHGCAAPVGPGGTASGVTDEEEDAEFNLMCVRAVEEVERRLASSATG